MPETGFVRRTAEERRAPHREAVRTVGAALRIVRGRPIVLSIVVIAVFSGAASEALDRLWELHFLDHFDFPTLGALDSVAWFGIINIGSLLIGLVSTEIIRRRVDTASHHSVSRTLIRLQLLLVVSIVAFGLAGDFAFALGAIWTYYLMRDLGGPLSDAWLNQSLEPRSRATVFSVAEQAHALGELIGGPIMGAIALVAMTRGAIVASAVVLLPSLWLYWRALGQGAPPEAPPEGPPAPPDPGGAPLRVGFDEPIPGSGRILSE